MLFHSHPSLLNRILSQPIGPSHPCCIASHLVLLSSIPAASHRILSYSHPPLLHPVPLPASRVASRRIPSYPTPRYQHHAGTISIRERTGPVCAPPSAVGADQRLLRLSSCAWLCVFPFRFLPRSAHTAAFNTYFRSFCQRVFGSVRRGTRNHRCAKGP